MYTNTIIAAGAFVAMVAAVPMADQHHHHHMHQHVQHKRDYVWVTHTEEVIETIAVTKTVWVEPGEETPDVQPAGYHHAPPHSAPAYNPPAPVEPTTTSVYVAPPAPTTPAYVAPTPTTPAYVAPVPTTTPVYVAPPAPTTPAYVAPTTEAPAPAETYAPATGSGPSGGIAAAGSSHSGDLTYYAVGMGACGWTNTSDQNVVAIAENVFDSYNIDGNPNHNPLCGKWLTITGANGQPFPCQIVDRCPGCAGFSLDLSEDFFNKVTNHADGRAHDMKWTMN